MKFLILTLCSVVSLVSADVSHLFGAGGASGYNYDRPQPVLNIPVPVEHSHAEQLSQPIEAPANEYLPPAHHEHHVSAPQYHAPAPVPAPAPAYHAEAAPSIDYLPPVHHAQLSEPIAPANEYLPPAHEEIASAPLPAPEYHAPAPVYHAPASAPIAEAGYHLPVPAPIHHEELSAPISAPTSDYLPPAIHPFEEISAPASQTGGYHYNSPPHRFRLHH